MLRSISLLLVATMAGMSLWFMAAAVLPDMAVEGGLSEARLAVLSSVVPAGFALGALAFAAAGLPDRLDPRYLFAACALVTADADEENGGMMCVPNTQTYVIQCPELADSTQFFTSEHVEPPRGLKPRMLRLKAVWSNVVGGALVWLDEPDPLSPAIPSPPLI